MRQARLLLGISVYWVGLSMLADGVTALVLPAAMVSTAPAGTRATWLGLISFAGLFVGLLVQPLAGAWSDRLRPRWGRRAVLALGTVLTLVALALLGVAPGLAGLLLGFVLLQAAASVAQAAQQGFIPDLVPAERRGLAAGLKSGADIAGSLLGFALLGSMLGAGRGGPALFALAAALGGALLLTVALVREPAGLPATATPRPTLADAFRLDLRANPRFARAVAARFLFLLGTFGVGRFLLLFVAERGSLPADRAAEAAGAALAILALLSVLAAPLAGWAADRLGREALMVAGALLQAAGALLLIGAGTLPTLVLYGALLALGSAAFTGANWAFTADLVPPREAARFMALANIGTAGAAAAAGLLGPGIDLLNRLAPGAGYPALFAICALASLAAALAVPRKNNRSGAEDAETRTGAHPNLAER